MPVLTRARSFTDGTVAFTWNPVPGATAYQLWLSTDGRTWDASDARTIATTSHRAGGLATGPIYGRVVAFNAQGWSAPSDVFAARVDTVGPRILLVDGNDRWDTQFENSRGLGHDFAVDTAHTLGTHSFDSVANEAISQVNLSDYEAVVWILSLIHI